MAVMAIGFQARKLKFLGIYITLDSNIIRSFLYLLLKILFRFWLMPKDSSSGGFVDYKTNTCIKAISFYLELAQK